MDDAVDGTANRFSWKHCRMGGLLSASLGPVFRVARRPVPAARIYVQRSGGILDCCFIPSRHTRYVIVDFLLLRRMPFFPHPRRGSNEL